MLVCSIFDHCLPIGLLVWKYISDIYKQEEQTRRLAHVFAAAVSADAADAGVEHLDATENHLQETHGQKNGEERDVPVDDVGRRHAQAPQLLVKQVALIPTGQPSRGRG